MSRLKLSARSCVVMLLILPACHNTDRFDSTDGTFKEAGKVGLWTKADSVTYFDDLRVTARWIKGDT